ncbi:N-acetyl-gamma-glutamyl-phosphate reductase [Asticcacaulis machinosus]|uniref:N-acetyl-gamma-glutamyl-phosphate reductase n=1 Tax=Asticcacaulis machinosus TaxID=2984211 RepID=A0ABT5HEU7_9CAUL|nr:N-acetyl-gamma-glutamyl-phosphate reductase [Asticcacaulis machinosus]MDC7674775.1 N-acetyl-gamma-glutamyl-phosphate reductase [Asticcacaulis machinosus]
MVHKVFIDGDVGTTGLLIRKRLEVRPEIELIRLDEAVRKDASARKAAINAADAVILCLPDEAAREAVSLVENPDVKIIDASTAHRVHEDWAYGFAEMAPGQRDEIRASKRISNPGCYATGFIALMRPLVDAGVIPPFWPSTVNAVSGYSGGGKSMIAEFEDGGTTDNYRIYATGLNHKHLPEMTVFSGLESPPVFTPAVGRFAQGMIVELPLQLWALPDEPELSRLHEIFAAHYEGETFVKVVPLEESQVTKGLSAELVKDTNNLLIHVFGDEDGQQARLVAVLDNLGKGASGAAVQNLNLALNLDETLGLI